MLVARAGSRHRKVFRTSRKTGFCIQHLGRFESAQDAAPVGSTRFGTVHD